MLYKSLRHTLVPDPQNIKVDMTLPFKEFKVGRLGVRYTSNIDCITVTDLEIPRSEPRDYYDEGLIDVLGVTVKNNLPVFADIFYANNLSSAKKIDLQMQIASFFHIPINDAKKILDFAH